MFIVIWNAPAIRPMPTADFHARSYEPIAEYTRPPPKAPTNDPIWWLKNAMPTIVAIGKDELSSAGGHDVFVAKLRK